MKRAKYLAACLYCYLQILLTGTALFQTFLMYPNIFYNPPHSLQQAMKFFHVVTPAHFFPPFGMAVLSTAVLAALAAFRNRPAFFYFIGSAAVLLAGDGILSVLYFWPLNEALFTEGMTVHSAAELREFSAKFVNAHYLRLATSILASALALRGLLAYRHEGLGAGCR